MDVATVLSLPPGTQRVFGGTTCNLVPLLETLPQVNERAGGQGTGRAVSVRETGGGIRTRRRGQM